AGLADVVVEATGHPSSVADGLSILRKDGVLVSAGIHARPASLDMTALVRNRQQIRGAHASRRTSWLSIARRIAEQPEDVLPMVSAELPLAEGLQGFAQCRARAVSKIILRPGD
ncbi:zinc-binding dehydrogenase, partial [Bordetella hinzii]|nr:zinc-binding dehydrogenase [Bordetella hinzii]